MEASEGRETERMATSAVQSAAESLTYFIQQKDFHLSHVEDSARTLRNKLNALLKDVDGMRQYNESVQLIEVAKNIKNVIDSFIIKIAQQRGETSAGLMSNQSTFNSGIKDKPAIEDLGKKIFDLKTRLDEIILSNRSQYSIQNIQASGEASTSSTQSQIQREKRAPIVEEAGEFSFEDETMNFIVCNSWIIDSVWFLSAPIAIEDRSEKRRSRSINKLVHIRSLSLMTDYGSWITELRFERSKLEQDSMVTLEKLPNLRSLCIYSNLFDKDAYMGKEMVCSAGGFPLLDTLTIHRFYKLEEWRVEEGAMPVLRSLEIKSCRRLKMLPDGLRHVTTLQELKLSGMSRGLKERVRKNEGEDWFKIRHIPSLIIE